MLTTWYLVCCEDGMTCKSAISFRLLDFFATRYNMQHAPETNANEKVYRRHKSRIKDDQLLLACDQKQNSFEGQEGQLTSSKHSFPPNETEI